MEYGTGRPMIFLHGWGQNIFMMKFLSDYFNNRIILIDLPGFGKSSEPNDVWSIFDYAECIHSLIEFLGIEDPILVGHSFGGKIALVYAYKYSVSKLILFAPPFRVVKKKLTFKQKFIKWFIKLPHFKFVKCFLKKRFGSTDYKNASYMMRNILVKHVNTDISYLLSDINVDTLIMWGTNDSAVSYMDGLFLNRLIKNSTFITFFGASHYAYLENIGETVRLINRFIV